MQILDLDTFPYDDAFAVQKRTVERLQSGTGAETLYLLEHPHVVTMGRNASRTSLAAGAALLQARGVQLAETDRGGDVTYHGPGQLVGYPILCLEPGRRDIRRYVSDVEEVILRTLKGFSIEGRRDPVHRGVWIDDRKIASVGIRISRWVTSHGLALNVNTDLSYFSLIHPCGIPGCEMTSMSKELNRPVEMAAVKEAVVRHFMEIFDRKAEFESSGGGVERYG